jgi:hypothetical protein
MLEETNIEESNEEISTEPAAEQLGEGGIKALETERKARKDAERTNKMLLAELEKVREGQLTESEKAIEQAKKEARQEALSEINSRIIATEIKAAAAGKLFDPADALTFIKVSDFEVDENGNVDSKEIEKALNVLLKEKPYLKAFQKTGDADSGARGKPAAPNTNDMNTMIRRAAGRQ